MKEIDKTPYDRESRMQRRETRRKQQMVNIAMLAILASAILATLVYFKPWANDTRTTPTQTVEGNVNETDISERQSKEILNAITKHILLPDEEPVMYSIDNADALIQEQAFFTNSQNGDVLLIYPKAAKAIIYSESRDIIVNVGPLTYEENDSSTSAQLE